MYKRGDTYDRKEIKMMEANKNIKKIV